MTIADDVETQTRINHHYCLRCNKRLKPDERQKGVCWPCIDAIRIKNRMFMKEYIHPNYEDGKTFHG
jgi:hypothetical protein